MERYRGRHRYGMEGGIPATDFVLSPKDAEEWQESQKQYQELQPEVQQVIAQQALKGAMSDSE